MTLRFEIFPDDLDATVDFYLRVLRFRLIADRRDEPSPYVSLQRGLRDFRVLDPAGYYLRVTDRGPVARRQNSDPPMMH